jgi:hypothetical protein
LNHSKLQSQFLRGSPHRCFSCEALCVSPKTHTNNQKSMNHVDDAQEYVGRGVNRVGDAANSAKDTVENKLDDAQKYMGKEMSRFRRLVYRFYLGMFNFSPKTKALDPPPEDARHITNIGYPAEVYMDYRVSRLTWVVIWALGVSIWNIVDNITSIIDSYEPMKSSEYLNLTVYLISYRIVQFIHSLSELSVVVFILLAAFATTYDRSKLCLKMAYAVPFLTLITVFCVPWAAVITPSVVLYDKAINTHIAKINAPTYLNYSLLYAAFYAFNIDPVNYTLTNEELGVIETSLDHLGVDAVYYLNETFGTPALVVEIQGDVQDVQYFANTTLVNAIDEVESEIITTLPPEQEDNVKENVDDLVKVYFGIYFSLIVLEDLGPYSYGLLKGSIRGFNIVLVIWRWAQANARRILEIELLRRVTMLFGSIIFLFLVLLVNQAVGSWWFMGCGVSYIISMLLPSLLGDTKKVRIVCRLLLINALVFFILTFHFAQRLKNLVERFMPGWPSMIRIILGSYSKGIQVGLISTDWLLSVFVIDASGNSINDVTSKEQKLLKDADSYAESEIENDGSIQSDDSLENQDQAKDSSEIQEIQDHVPSQ